MIAASRGQAEGGAGDRLDLRRSIEAAEREPIALDNAQASSNPSSEARVA